MTRGGPEPKRALRFRVMAGGLPRTPIRGDPAIPIGGLSLTHRDHRDKPGDDKRRRRALGTDARIRVIPYARAGLGRGGVARSKARVMRVPG